MDKKIEKVFTYWTLVFTDAIEILASDIRGVAIAVVSVFILACISTVAYFFKLASTGWVDQTWDQAFLGAASGCVTGILLVLALFFILAYLPAKKHYEQIDTIENNNKTIEGFEEKLSSKKIGINDDGNYRVPSNLGVELQFTIYNDSSFPMENWNALVEKVEYAKDNVQIPKETDFPKNRFHLAWTGDPAMAYRTKPIQSHDYAQIAIAETLTRLNAFKISTIESSEIRFKKPGYYIVTLRISGTFDGTSVSRRIEISLLYKGKKGIEKIISHTDLMDLSELQ